VSPRARVNIGQSFWLLLIPVFWWGTSAASGWLAPSQTSPEFGFLEFAVHSARTADYGIDPFTVSIAPIDPSIIEESLTDQGNTVPDALIPSTRDLGASSNDEDDQEEDSPSDSQPAPNPTPAPTTDPGGNGNGNGEGNSGGNGNGGGNDGENGNAGGNDGENGNGGGNGNSGGNGNGGNNGNGGGNGKNETGFAPLLTGLLASL
jgi:hypothetical protein